MSKTKKWLLFAIVIIVAGLLLARFVLPKGDSGTRVTAEEAKQRTIVETVSASGKLFPEMEIKVGSPIPGELTQLLVQEGDSVKKGQVLARIQGEKGGAQAPRVSIPNIPPGFEGLVQSMQPPKTSTGQSAATITAPIGGTVTALYAKRGERIGAMQLPGSELLRIADMATIEVRVDVNENNVIKIATGDSAVVEVEAYNKRKFKGIVSGIANGGTKRDAQSFLSNDVTSYEVRIRLLPSSYADLYDNNRRRSMPFRPGMNARAEIQTKKREGVLSVPVGAVVSRPKGSDASGENEKSKTDRDSESALEETTGQEELEEVVYILKEDGTVTKRVVSTGIQDLSFFEIISGLKAGEKVVTGPYSAVSKSLQSGKKVTVVSKEKIFQND